MRAPRRPRPLLRRAREGLDHADTAQRQQALLAFRQSTHRAFLLDWGGTLTPADTGFYDVREGAVRIDDHDVREASQPAQPSPPPLQPRRQRARG